MMISTDHNNSIDHLLRLKSKATEIQMALRKINFLPTRILPTVEGGLNFSFDKGNKHGILEVHDDGGICFAIYEGEAVQVEEVGISVDEIQKVVNTIYAFINNAD
jgi:hypothetical protein